ncbi:MAG: hypothetical protein NT065_06120 [Chlamydiae bacterium]|nr:hypothetical protein [Chlamydiota bacterium]
MYAALSSSDSNRSYQPNTLTNYRSIHQIAEDEIGKPLTDGAVTPTKSRQKQISALLVSVNNTHQAQENLNNLNNIAIVSSGRTRSLSGSFEPLTLENQLSNSVDAIVIDSIRAVDAYIVARRFSKIEPPLIYRDALEGGVGRTHTSPKRSLSLDSLDPIKRPILFPIGKGYTNMPPKKIDNKQKHVQKEFPTLNNTCQVLGANYERWDDGSIVWKTIGPDQTQLVIDPHQAKHCDAMNFHSTYGGKSGSTFLGFTFSDMICFVDNLYDMDDLIWSEDLNKPQEGVCLRDLFSQELAVSTVPKERVACLNRKQWSSLKQKRANINNAPLIFSEEARKLFHVMNHENFPIMMHSSFQPKENNQKPFWAIHMFPGFPQGFNIRKRLDKVRLYAGNRFQ